jgi:hypothetical protein
MDVLAVDTERLCWTERAAMRATPAFIRANDMMMECVFGEVVGVEMNWQY